MNDRLLRSNSDVCCTSDGIIGNHKGWMIAFLVKVCLSILIVVCTSTESRAQSNAWTWMGGSETPGLGGLPGVYGTLKTPAAGNTPGSRGSSVTWTDPQGNLWLFGGYGDDSIEGTYLNDLWEFNITLKQWAWMGGSNAASLNGGSLGVYGTLGTPASGNIPGGREAAVSWTDSNGNFWLFGGFGLSGAYISGAANSDGYLNDLWEFSSSTNQWTWIGGNNSFGIGPGGSGVYGAMGTPASVNIPGGREGAVSWKDSKGNFWLFGGYGLDSNGTLCYLNDLWEFSPATGQWEWVSGSSTVSFAAGQSNTSTNAGQPGVYGTVGTAASANTPGSRVNAMGWTDGSGNLWLFGGYGADANRALGDLNDLWEFNPSIGEWTWMGGNRTLNGLGGVSGVYVTWMSPSVANVPGGRDSGTSWTDSQGNLWLFGGYGFDSAGAYGYLNDLWEFNPSTGQWTWMDGSANVPGALASQTGVYGTLQTSAFMNTPGGRNIALGWTDRQGNLWLFGGYSQNYMPSPATSLVITYFNDLWKYQPSSGALPEAATPTFSLSSGTYAAGQTVTISDSTSGATIYYFVSGSASAMPYAGPITISSTETIEAVAVASGYTNSAVATETYTVPQVAAPAFSLPSGTYATSLTVSISDATPGVTIYYAINAVPTTSSTVYNGPFTVSSSETIQAIAVASGYSMSAPSSARYTIWASSAVNQWAWMGGNNQEGVFSGGVYGTLGVTARGNFPGVHQSSSTWIDISGNLWLFGGQGRDSEGNWGYLNDLWKFIPQTNEWTWMGGGSVVACHAATCSLGGYGQSGAYGTLGALATGNIPGAREGAATWVDSKGNFWLFGGYGYDSIGTLAFLNDLWEFNPSTDEWIWKDGDNTVTGTCIGNFFTGLICGGEPGVYGTQGIPAVGNIPGGRDEPTTWVDSQGNFWLFGGYTFDSKNQIQYAFNDLWEFSPSNNQWTWVGGSNSPDGSYCFNDNSHFPYCGQGGSYGTLGTPFLKNVPGGRSGATGWVDKSGNLWLAGGAAFDAYGSFNPLNDVWEFHPSNNEWAWVGGSSASPLCVANNNNSCGDVALSPIYGSTGSLGVPAAGNIPQLFASAASWTDSNGNLWLFGGYDGLPSSGWNDLFVFTPTANEWTWMNGSSLGLFGGAAGVYGKQGASAPGNTPGSRNRAATWTDNSGRFWLFGGYGYAVANSPDNLNDLWVYQPSAPTLVPSYAVVAQPVAGSANASLSVAAGNSGTVTINVTAAGGFNSAVALGASGEPNGVSVNFNPASITSTGSSQMTISTNFGTAVGEYPITVTGTSGNTVETTTVTLNVTSAPPAAFTLGASPRSLTINSGGQGAVTLTVTPQYGFNSAINFACSGLPAGVTCVFNPSTVTPVNGAVTTQMTLAATSQASITRPAGLPLFPAMALAGFACLIGWRQRQKLSQWLVIVAAFTMLGFLSACGGGGSSSVSTIPTPTNATITVTATSATVMQTTDVSLTLN